MRERLEGALVPALQEVTRSVSADGQTTKWLWELEDRRRVETVLMLYPDRATVCVSSQAGCAMGCSFCATGQGGFDRHLSVGEIVEQVVVARREALPRRLGNVVFMGMGEPLANYDRTWSAVERIHSELGLSARHITLSTVGVVPGIRRLATEALPVNLAVSLHAARDELRDQMVPLNRRYPLSVLMGACGEYLAAKGRRLSFEWALIDGVNDSPRDAAELAELALPLGAHVNVIPLNPTPGYAGRGAGSADVAAFRRLVERARRQRHGPGQPGHRHRRCVRPTGGPGESGNRKSPASATLKAVANTQWLDRSQPQTLYRPTSCSTSTRGSGCSTCCWG